MTGSDEHADAADPSTRPSADRSARQRFGAMPRWKKLLLIGAGALVVLGLALLPFDGGAATTATGADGGAPPAGAASLVGGGGPGGTTGEPGDAGESAGAGNLSPAFLRLGFGFFVGFAIGYALRSFLKLVLVFVGIQLIALFGLSYVEWVTVNWAAMNAFFDGFVERVQQEAGAFQTFVTGSLPTAGLASLGLYTGFRRG